MSIFLSHLSPFICGGCVVRTAGMQVLGWNGIPLMGKTYEEVQSIVGQQQSGDVEICVRL